MKKTTTRRVQFVVCLNNDGHKASLDVGKLYRSIPDRAAAAEGLIRVIDESGEDYAFAADRFHKVFLPPKIKKELSGARRR